MKINTTPGETYIVLSTGGCTATTGAGKQIKRLAAGQDFFTAMTGDTVISDDNANVTVAKGELLSLLNTDSTGSGVQATLQFQPVTNQSALPTPGENGVIYLVPNNAEAPNQYTEWVWTGAAYEQLGDVGVDLDGYVSKEDLDITSIEAGETGPQITSGATLITKAAQVDSLKVGDFVSASPPAEPDGLSNIIITSTVVNLAENVDVNLGTGTRINLSESSWLSGEQVRLSGITVVGALRFGSSGITYHLDGSSGRLGRITLVNGLQLGPSSGYGFDTFGDGTLGDLAVLGGLQLGSGGTYGFDSQGHGKLYTLTVTNTLQYGESGKYGVDQSGNGSLWTLSVMNELQLGDVDSYKYWLNSSGDGKLKKLIVTDGLQLGNIGTYSLGGGGNGKLGHLTVMGTLDVSDTTTVRGDLSVMGTLGVDDLTVNEDLSVMGTLYFGDGSGMYRYNVTNEGDGCLNSISVMQGLYFGNDTAYRLDSNGVGRLDSLTVVTTLAIMNGDIKLGDNSEYYLQSGGDGRLHDLDVTGYLEVTGGISLMGDLSLMGTLKMGDTSNDYYLESDGDGCLNHLTVMAALQLGPSYEYTLYSSGYGRLSGLTLSGLLNWTDDAAVRPQLSDFGHPLAAKADSRAISAGWVEASHVQVLSDVETPVLKSPEDSLLVMCSLNLEVYKNPDGGTEVPTLRAPNIVCDALSADTLEAVNVHAYSHVEAMTLSLAAGRMQFGVMVSEVATCYIGSGCNIDGPGWDKIFSDTYTRLGLGSAGTGTVSVAEGVRTSAVNNRQIYIGIGDIDATVTGAPQFKSYRDVTSPYTNYVEITGASLNVSGGGIEVADAGSYVALTDMAQLTLGEGSTISGPGWDAMVADIQAGAAAAAAEAEQPSFTKLTFPPTGTATEEQDPSWITKSHIIMQTNGGQLNLTQLTATLAYAAQTPLAIAKRTLWLSTSSGTGDAVQWPANAVFPDDQSQDKIQQLNSNSTYWFDITYVGGSDTVLIRKVCSWAATTGESGPTE